MSNNGDIPEEILVNNILSRLPVKSLCRFKSVSKLWQTYISDPTFIKTHLSRQNTHHKVIIVSPSGSLFSVNLDDASNNNAIATKLELPIELSSVLCCCNGLLLLTDKMCDKVLLNPSTRSYMKLRPTSSFFSRDDGFIKYGLGYDSSVDDYKVVRIHQDLVPIYDDDYDGPDIYYTDVEIYASKSGCWNRIGTNYPYDNGCITLEDLFFLNGSLHWMTSYDSGLNVIAAFKLSDENYWDVPPPPSLDNRNFFFYKLKVLGGCLCMFACYMDVDNISVWVMKEYGVVDSWTEFKISKPNKESRITPLCLLSDEEVLLEADNCKFLVWNTKEGNGRDMVVNGYSDEFKACVTFVESLVSPICWEAAGRQDNRFSRKIDVDLLRFLREMYVPDEGYSKESFKTSRAYTIGSTSSSNIDDTSISVSDPFLFLNGLDCLIDPEVQEEHPYEKEGLKDV